MEETAGAQAATPVTAVDSLHRVRPPSTCECVSRRRVLNSQTLMLTVAYIRRSCAAFAGVMVLGGVAGADGASAAGDASATVTVSVGPLRNLRGSVACRLFKTGEGFPRTTKGTVTVRVKVSGTMTPCTFERLPPGTYAVMVHHDENDNRKVDKNFLGVPLEGYGASNNHVPALSAPSWDDSKFTVERGKVRRVAIGLRYGL